MTKPVTRKMAVDCLLAIAVDSAQPYVCYICRNFIFPDQDIQFDHVHADVHGGPHEYRNLRPVHVECHKKKTARDIKDNAKVKRLRGETCTGPKKRIQSRGFQKRPEGHEYNWGKRPRPNYTPRDKDVRE